MLEEYLKRLSELERLIDSQLAEFTRLDDENSNNVQAFLTSLTAVTGVVRGVQSAGLPLADFRQITQEADRILHISVGKVTYPSARSPFSDPESHLPSFAHDDELAPLVKDTSKGGLFCMWP